jgi:ABC-type multidrug transport system fused ATPase/permease subunit
VEQTPTLFNLSIAENIAYGLENVTFDEIVEAAKLANIHEFINSLPKVRSAILITNKLF